MKSVFHLKSLVTILRVERDVYKRQLSATQSELRDSLMIGDSWENDITGAARVGMHQVFYNIAGITKLPFTPTYQIADLKEDVYKRQPKSST